MSFWMQSELRRFVFLCLLQQYVICTISTHFKQTIDQILKIPAVFFTPHKNGFDEE